MLAARRGSRRILGWVGVGWSAWRERGLGWEDGGPAVSGGCAGSTPVPVPVKHCRADAEAGP